MFRRIHHSAAVRKCSDGKKTRAALQPKESPILVSDFVGVCKAQPGLLVMERESPGLAYAKWFVLDSFRQVLDCDRP